ncbi:MAG: hypothetical protein KC713_07115, partial [Candidatus Omnitrophica bacterium]|nr:hypothetical protein [Candidatus Omnitrophota bacterium]
QHFGETNLPVDTFNKVWIYPERAHVYEQKDRAFFIDGHLKVMLEEDYFAMKNAEEANLNKNSSVENPVLLRRSEKAEATKKIIKRFILPVIEKEVNEGKHFAPLRQMFHAMVLAAWFKSRLKASFLGQQFADQNKLNGLQSKDSFENEEIYQEYLKTFEKGVFNYIKEDYDPVTESVIPRKYFSGGYTMKAPDGAMLNERVEFSVEGLGQRAFYEAGSHQEIVAVNVNLALNGISQNEISPDNKMQKKGSETLNPDEIRLNYYTGKSWNIEQTDVEAELWPVILNLNMLLGEFYEPLNRSRHQPLYLLIVELAYEHVFKKTTLQNFSKLQKFINRLNKLNEKTLPPYLAWDDLFIIDYRFIKGRIEEIFREYLESDNEQQMVSSWVEVLNNLSERSDKYNSVYSDIQEKNITMHQSDDILLNFQDMFKGTRFLEQITQGGVIKTHIFQISSGLNGLSKYLKIIKSLPEDEIFILSLEITNDAKTKHVFLVNDVKGFKKSFEEVDFMNKMKSNHSLFNEFIAFWSFTVFKDTDGMRVHLDSFSLGRKDSSLYAEPVMQSGLFGRELFGRMVNILGRNYTGKKVSAIDVSVKQSNGKGWTENRFEEYFYEVKVSGLVITGRIGLNPDTQKNSLVTQNFASISEERLRRFGFDQGEKGLMDSDASGFLRVLEGIFHQAQKRELEYQQGMQQQFDKFARELTSFFKENSMKKLNSYLVELLTQKVRQKNIQVTDEEVNALFNDHQIFTLAEVDGGLTQQVKLLFDTTEASRLLPHASQRNQSWQYILGKTLEGIVKKVQKNVQLNPEYDMTSYFEYKVDLLLHYYFYEIINRLAVISRGDFTKNGEILRDFIHKLESEEDQIAYLGDKNFLFTNAVSRYVFEGEVGNEWKVFKAYQDYHEDLLFQAFQSDEQSGLGLILDFVKSNAMHLLHQRHFYPTNLPETDDEELESLSVYQREINALDYYVLVLYGNILLQKYETLGKRINELTKPEAADYQNIFEALLLLLSCDPVFSNEKFGQIVFPDLFRNNGVDDAITQPMLTMMYKKVQSVSGQMFRDIKRFEGQLAGQNSILNNLVLFSHQWNE